MTNPFSGKAVDVDRVLLVRYPQSLTTRDLAKESQVSLGEASKVSRALVDQMLAIRDSAHSTLKLMDPAGLLTRLAAIRNFVADTKFIEYYTPEEDMSKFLSRLKELHGPEYAVTGLAAALFVAPFVRPTNVHIYVKTEEDAMELARRLDLMPVEKNGNVKFGIAKSSGVFYGAQEINGIEVVSPQQLYLDLRNYPARGEEAANEVYKVIEHNWETLRVS
jgi:Transcriptional regulator, AbiEi antitoxin, Type IV TA system